MKMLPPKEQMDMMRQEQEQRFTKDQLNFGPPDFGDEEGLEDEHSEEVVYIEEEDDDLEKERIVYDRDRYPTQPIETPSIKNPRNEFLEEDFFFPEGPLKTEVSAWKKKFEVDGHHIHFVEVQGEKFIFRTLNRVEYREIMALPNTDPIQREEIICECCILFPYSYDFTDMGKSRAGVPAIIAEQIMKESGFAKIAAPIRL